MTLEETGSKFRLMQEKDLAGVMEINDLVYKTTWSASFLRQQLRQKESRLNIVFELQEKILGHGALMKVVDEAHIISLAVHPSHHKTGIGSSLLTVLCQEAVKMGMKSMTLEVRASNDPAIKLYKKFGFAPVGFRTNYYSDTGEDALIMWIHDIDNPEFLTKIKTKKRIEGDL
ncbi:MAG: ribosomal-protein-alanine N-acetyltransferase [Acidimicrobiaceae bacterium]|nr:ribosomal-protein-alanine N-acetyltransferase [Acidimicrobiaceae bacterium]